MSIPRSADSVIRSGDALTRCCSRFRIKSLVLKNRIMSTSHACGLEDGGLPTERYQLYHEEKAKGGIALTMFGGSSNVDAGLARTSSGS